MTDREPPPKDAALPLIEHEFVEGFTKNGTSWIWSP